MEFAHWSFARHLEPHARADRRAGDIRLERHIVHVDEMLPERVDVDLRPVCLRVRVQKRDDFLDCGEGALAGLGRARTLLLRGRLVLARHHHQHVLAMRALMGTFCLRERGGGREEPDQNNNANHKISWSAPARSARAWGRPIRLSSFRMEWISGALRRC